MYSGILERCRKLMQSHGTWMGSKITALILEKPYNSPLIIVFSFQRI